MAVMALVPRHEFVPPSQVPLAYMNRPLPIGYGQTIAQPRMLSKGSARASQRRRRTRARRAGNVETASFRSS